MPTHFFTIPLHEEHGVKPDSIFQRNVMPDSFFMFYLIPLYLIPLYLIPVYCYAWFQNQVSLLCQIPLYHFLLYHIPLPCYNWFRYTSFCYAWFPLPTLCLIPLYHFPLCPNTLYQVPHPRFFGFFAPPPHVHKITQPRLLSLSTTSAFGPTHPLPLSEYVLNGSPLIWYLQSGGIRIPEPSKFQISTLQGPGREKVS